MSESCGILYVVLFHPNGGAGEKLKALKSLKQTDTWSTAVGSFEAFRDSILNDLFRLRTCHHILLVLRIVSYTSAYPNFS